MALFERELIVQLANPWIGPAEDAIDIESFQSYKVDMRGRIEAGVKPAGRSAEKPAYAKITVRGRTLTPECNLHGRGKWCLHSTMLALHHCGYRMTVKSPTRASGQPSTGPQIGFQLQMSVQPDGLTFQIRSLSSGQPIRQPLTFLNQTPPPLGLSAEQVQFLADHAEAQDHPPTFQLERELAASFFQKFWQVPLFQTHGQPWAWLTHSKKPQPTEIWVDQAIHVQLPHLADDLTLSFLAAGPVGYGISNQKIVRLAGPVADLQPFLDQIGQKIALPLEPESLYFWLKQRFGVLWQTSKPMLIQDLDGLELDLDPSASGLTGQWQIRLADQVYPLPNEDSLQLLGTFRNHPLLFRLNPNQRQQLANWRQKIRAPWQGTAFHLNAHQAPQFLEKNQFPSELYVDRGPADQWFGLQEMAVEVHWSEGTPQYKIAGQTFDHQALFSGILPDFSGVHLGHGQVLRFDARTVALNQEILHGTRALASDPHTRARLLDKILNGATEPLAEIPNLPEKLRPYQREGVAWLLQRAKQLEPALLADEMGLGKTFQTLVFLLHLKEYSEPGPQLIVLPTSLLTNWQRECEMHTPDRKITIYHGGSRQAEPLSTADLVLTTYGIVMRDQETLASIPWQAVILDEAQAIKNVSSQTAEAVFSLKAQYRMALTGTPLENHPGELASIFHFLAPGYCGPPDRYAKVFHPEQPAYKALKLKTAPFMLRRLKKQVATDLPDRQEISLFLPMDAEQKRLYDKIRSQALETNTDGKPNNMAVLTQLLRLRQVACHPGLVDEACLAQASPKLIYLTERLLELNESGQTALVFSQFTSLLKIAKNHLENHDLHCLYLDGATRDRQALVDRFQAGHGDVFLISLKAGGTGLNLTRANYVFHLDPWWNPMVEAQATDRTHRIGQTQTVFSYKLVSAESIEQKVLALQEQKRLLADDLWQTGAWKPSLGELSDLLDL